jgi:hypothetical protein
MFGKKKHIVDQVKDFHCLVCGIDCNDQDGLSRHMSWAHPESVDSNTKKADNHVRSDRKA